MPLPFRVLQEKYPDLRLNQNFLALQSQLEGTENRIAFARRNYRAGTTTRGCGITT